MSEEYDGGVWHRGLQANPHGAQHCEAPCVRCGTLTTRRAITGVGIVVPHAGENYYAPERAPWCAACERRACMAVLQQRQQNPVMLPAVKASEAVYLAELLQLNREAA